MSAPDPTTRDSWASSVVGTTAAGAGAEMSPTFAGGYRHGGVGGENGGGILIKEAGICQECGYYRSAWYQTHPEPFFDQHTYIVLADPHPETENFFFIQTQRIMAFPPCKPFVP